ncbi:unnamed protein product [Cuscuta epithymum]|uniref:Retrovirus-related Pol polyprotein from transposon TNT 1-94-like beta-barrel domain-containing protein n=1 Tax=Cuscuta epithymum TaxID=186058 RepID=A0AAV0FJ28_9ASTE|nr:unnamed protein product [Cuscuta epithymum]
MTNDAAISAANGTGRICEVIISNAIGSGGISLEDTRLMRNSKDDVGSLPNFSNEQQPGLLKLIENIRATSSDGKLSGKRCEVDWLLNSGASYHMTGCAQLMTSNKKLTPILVSMPNGETTHATSVGDIHLSPEIVIKNVLHVPGLKCNLISIARLIDDLKCDIYFTTEICVIQGRPSRTPIGAGIRQGGCTISTALNWPSLIRRLRKNKG